VKTSVWKIISSMSALDHSALRIPTLGVTGNTLHHVRQFMGKNITGACYCHPWQAAMAIEKALEAVFVHRDLGPGPVHNPGRRESVRSDRSWSVLQRADSKSILNGDIAGRAMGGGDLSGPPIQMNADFLEYTRCQQLA
jgi:hypothetical protein